MCTVKCFHTFHAGIFTTVKALSSQLSHLLVLVSVSTVSTRNHKRTKVTFKQNILPLLVFIFLCPIVALLHLYRSYSQAFKISPARKCWWMSVLAANAAILAANPPITSSSDLVKTHPLTVNGKIKPETFPNFPISLGNPGIHIEKNTLQCTLNKPSQRTVSRHLAEHNHQWPILTNFELIVELI